MSESEFLTKWITQIERAEKAYQNKRVLVDQLYILAKEQDEKLAVALAHNAAGEGCIVIGQLLLLREAMQGRLKKIKDEENG